MELHGCPGQGRTGGKIWFGRQVLGGAKTDLPLLRRLSEIYNFLFYASPSLKKYMTQLIFSAKCQKNDNDRQGYEQYE